MEASSIVRRSAGGLWEGLRRVVTRRNSIYVTFVIAGAFIDERVVNYGVDSLLEYNNQRKQYEDLPCMIIDPEDYDDDF